MYRWLVERMIRRSFRRLGEGDHEALVRQMAPGVEHFFPGDHALGGTRRGVGDMRRWLRRLSSLFPGLHFEIREVFVKGWPWRTVAAVEWVDRAWLPTGEPFVNDGVHVLHLCWGRVVRFRAYTDGQLVANTLERLARDGVSEADAPPINTAVRGAHE